MALFPLAGSLVLLACALLAGSAAGADDVDVVPLSEIPLNLDLSVPESPAFTGLGLSPEKVTRPATPRELAAGLLSGLDENGNFQAGVALDTVPFLLIRGNHLTLSEYQEDPLGFNPWRQLSRLQLSAATTKGTEGDDDAVRLALGIRATPWSRGDPRLDTILTDCFREVASTLPGRPASDLPFEEMPEGSLTDPPPGAGPPAAGAGEDAALRRIDAYLGAVDAWQRVATKRSEACVASSEKRLSKASAWDIGLAPTWIAPDGGDDDLAWGGGTAWTSLAYGFEEWFSERDDAGNYVAEEDRRGVPSQTQLIGHVRVRIDGRTPDPTAADGFVRQDSILAGLRLRFGEKLPLSLEAAYVHEDAKGESPDDSVRGSLTAEIPVYEQVWLELGLGVSAGRDDDRVQLGGTLKWGGEQTDLAGLVNLFAQ